MKTLTSHNPQALTAETLEEGLGASQVPRPHSCLCGQAQGKGQPELGSRGDNLLTFFTLPENAPKTLTVGWVLGGVS